MSVQIRRVAFTLTLEENEAPEATAEVLVPEGFIPFRIDGPRITGDQRTDWYGPFEYELWCWKPNQQEKEK